MKTHQQSQQSQFPKIGNRKNYDLFDVFMIHDRHVIMTDRTHIIWESLGFKLVDNSKLTEKNLKFEACWEYADFDLPRYVENPEEAIGKIVRYKGFTALIVGANTGRTGGFTLLTTDGDPKYVDDFFFHPEYESPITQMGYLDVFND